MKSIKDIINYMKDKMSTVTISTSQSAFIINGKSFNETKLLGEGEYRYVYEISDSKSNKHI